MIQPARSPVAPRVISPISGDVTPLVDQIEGLLVRGKPIRVRLEGEGRTEALSHLAAAFPEPIAADRLHLDDESQPFELGDSVVTVVTSKLIICDLVLSLCAWSRDDFIEYLFARLYVSSRIHTLRYGRQPVSVARYTDGVLYRRL